MIKKDINQIAKLCDGKLNKASDVEIIGVSKDTRTIQKGNLYIPIVGENFDGHNFVKVAEENGAVASLWEENRPLPNVEIPLILVENSLKAFHKLAKNYRNEIDPIVIALTGSNGKTTTKDMLTSILSQKYKTISNFGNQNNEIGVPLTLLSLEKDTEVAVVEMGTERFGEIIVLTEMALPDYALITNIGDSHLEELLTKENVAIEKMDIVKGEDKDGVFAYNLDDEILTREVQKQNPKLKVLSFGQNPDADFKIKILDSTSDHIDFTINGDGYRVPSPGIHQAYNAAAAIAIVSQLGMVPAEIQRGLDKVSFTKMRNEIKEMDGFSVLDDSYKSNPQNLLSALDILYKQDKYPKKILALADMLGLGEKAYDIHKEVGEQIQNDKVDLILLYGDMMKGFRQGALKNFPEEKVLHFESKEDLCNELAKHLEKDTMVLVKGSRYMKMEDVVNFLSEQKIEG